MNLLHAMSYARNADYNKETIACLTKWYGNYCVFILRYDVIEDEEEPEDNGPRYFIDYVGSKLNDPYSIEGETYDGANFDELVDDVIEYISPDELNFQIYKTTTSAETVVHIYHDLMPDIPDYEQVTDKQFYQHQVDRVLHHLKKQK